MEATEKPLDAVFIEVEVDGSIENDADLAKKLEEVCPVDIFANAHGSVGIVEGNLDECVLCRLCIDATPQGTVTVVKKYSGETLE